MLGMLIRQALEEARDAYQPELALAQRLAYVVSHGARTLATLGGDVVSAALDEGSLALEGWREERRFLEHGPPCFDPSGDFDRDDDQDDFDDDDDDPYLNAALAERDAARKNLLAEETAHAQTRAERDQAVAAHAAAVAQAAEAAAVGLRRETELRQLQEEALRELRQKLAVALGERDAKDRAVDHQIGVLRKLREEIADQGRRLDALTADARALCRVLLDEERVEAPVLGVLNQLRRRLGDAA